MALHGWPDMKGSFCRIRETGSPLKLCLSAFEAQEECVWFFEFIES
jgi:hypothetical protein